MIKIGPIIYNLVLMHNVFKNRIFSLNSKSFSAVKKFIYLDVPITIKDEVKELGAKWDIYRKKWYITEGKSLLFDNNALFNVLY